MDVILTIDYEDWYQVPLAGIDSKYWNKCSPTLYETTPIILNFLNNYNIKATFFVTGYIANRHPDLIVKIFKEGHKIESHGYWHKLTYLMTLDEFEEDIVKSKEIITKITGTSPIGYRAPAWSSTKWPEKAGKILTDNGFIYDSSLFPLASYLFNKKQLSPTPYSLSQVKPIEIPPASFNIFNLRIPLSLGLFLRFFKLPIALILIKQLYKNNFPPILYFHPWELTSSYPKQKIPLLSYFIQYYNCGIILNKLQKLAVATNIYSIENKFNFTNKNISKKNNLTLKRN